MAFHAAGPEHLYPQAGDPWQPDALYAATHPDSGVGDLGVLLTRVGKKVLSVPDEHVTETVDVSDCTDLKLAAILAHRSGAARERPLPGILSRLPAAERESIIATEYFTLLGRRPAPDGAVPRLSR